ncbi:MAG: hypothetical protein WAQ48_06235, partial [Limnochordia bacterium]
REQLVDAFSLFVSQLFIPQCGEPVLLVDINVQYGHVEIEFWRKGIKLLNRWDEISTLNTPD